MDRDAGKESIVTVTYRRCNHVSPIDDNIPAFDFRLPAGENVFESVGLVSLLNSMATVSPPLRRFQLTVSC